MENSIELNAKRAAAARAFRQTDEYKKWRRQYEIDNRVKRNGHRRRYCRDNREKINTYNAEYKAIKGPQKRAQNTEANRVKKGLPAPTRPEPSLCELCGRDSGKRCGLHLDHDHITGKFRGWICYRCNLALGMLGDSLAGVLRAVDYLMSNV